MERRKAGKDCLCVGCVCMTDKSCQLYQETNREEGQETAQLNKLGHKNKTVGILKKSVFCSLNFNKLWHRGPQGKRREKATESGQDRSRAKQESKNKGRDQGAKKEKGEMCENDGTKAEVALQVKV